VPTYDYVCRGCGHEFELFQSMKDAPKRKCPQCAKNALERLIGTGAAIIFKGGGFYETDYRSEAYQKAAKAETSDSGKPSESTKAEPAAAPAGDASAAPATDKASTTSAKPEPKTAGKKPSATATEPKPAGSKGKGAKPASSA
jgi:putative FmdB family regulatory protein